MWRVLLVGVLFGAMLLVGVAPAAALDYEEPVVPNEFRQAVEPIVPEIEGAMPAIRFRLALEDEGEVLVAPTLGFEGSGVTWVRSGAPGPGRAIPLDQWEEEGSGRTLWNWGK